MSAFVHIAKNEDNVSGKDDNKMILKKYLSISVCSHGEKEGKKKFILASLKGNIQ